MGIDPSMNSTGVSFRLSDGDLRSLCISSGGRKGMDRISYARYSLENLLNTYTPDLVAFEGYALGFRGASNAIFSLAEAGGALKLLIYDRDIAILSVPPSSLKLFATGKGNADKSKVGLALKEQVGVSFSSSDQNDAAWLLLMGEAYLNRRLLPRDRKHHRRRGMVGCQLLG